MARWFRSCLFWSYRQQSGAEVYCQLLVCLARTSVDGNRLHGSRSLSRLSHGSRTSLKAKKVALVLIQGANQLLIFATILFFTLITLSRGETPFPLTTALALWAGMSLLIALVEASFGQVSVLRRTCLERAFAAEHLSCLDLLGNFCPKPGRNKDCILDCHSPVSRLKHMVAGFGPRMARRVERHSAWSYHCRTGNRNPSSSQSGTKALTRTEL